MMLVLHFGFSVKLSNFFPSLIYLQKTNRILLNWFKLWDECVFHKSVTEVYDLGDDILTLDCGDPRRPKYKASIILSFFRKVHSVWLC